MCPPWITRLNRALTDMRYRMLPVGGTGGAPRLYKSPESGGLQGLDDELIHYLLFRLLDLRVKAFKIYDSNIGIFSILYHLEF